MELKKLFSTNKKKFRVEKKKLRSPWEQKLKLKAFEHRKKLFNSHLRSRLNLQQQKKLLKAIRKRTASSHTFRFFPATLPVAFVSSFAEEIFSAGIYLQLQVTLNLFLSSFSAFSSPSILRRLPQANSYSRVYFLPWWTVTRELRNYLTVFRFFFLSFHNYRVSLFLSLLVGDGNW